MVRAAMLAADWPQGPYTTQYKRFDQHVNVEVDTKEKPNQLITLMIEDPANWYNANSFRYVAPVQSRINRNVAGRLAMLGLWFACLPAYMVIIPRHFYFAIFRPESAKTLAIAVDRAANSALHGNHNETISSRANRAKVNGRKWGCVLCKFLDWFKRGHCEDAAGK